jgi:hypothetical protein
MPVIHSRSARVFFGDTDVTRLVREVSIQAKVDEVATTALLLWGMPRIEADGTFRFDVVPAVTMPLGMVPSPAGPLRAILIRQDEE